MKKMVLLLSAILVASALPSFASAQSYEQGRILKWNTEAYGKHGNVTRNAAIYYVRLGKTVYRITRGTTKPDPNLQVGQLVQCRVEKDHMFLRGEKGKEVRYSIVGATESE